MGVATAPDFTEDLIWNGLSAEARREIETEGKWVCPSEYAEEGYPITWALIEDGRRHLLLRGPVAVRCPVRLIHVEPSVGCAMMPYPNPDTRVSSDASGSSALGSFHGFVIFPSPLVSSTVGHHP